MRKLESLRLRRVVGDSECLPGFEHELALYTRNPQFDTYVPLKCAVSFNRSSPGETIVVV